MHMHNNNIFLQFDTRDKKPKVYNIAVLSCLTAVLFAVLSAAPEEILFQWANIILAVYFGIVIAMLADAFLKQLQYNPYSYNTIIYSGFAFFSLFMMGAHATAAVQFFLRGGNFSRRQVILLLVNSAKSYMLYTSPFLLVFSVLLFISNVTLIRREGRRFVNILGIILSFLLVGGNLVITLLDRQLTATDNRSVPLHLLVNVCAALYLYFECMIVGSIIADLIAASYCPAKDKDFLIVLGCGLQRDGTPTPLLKGRLDLALQFWREQRQETGRTARFVCSGGQGPDEVQSEAASMCDYLISKGIRADRILIEDRSSDTAENMRFSYNIIREIKPGAKAAFFTTNYHVFRAGLKARRVKMRAVGMGAPTRWYFWPNAAVREFVGLLTEHRGKQALIMAGALAAYITLTILAYR